MESLQESVYKPRRCRDTYDAPVIITGCPRTGAAALARCLSGHAAICVLPEACVYDLKDEFLARRRTTVWDQLPFSLDGAARAAIDALPPGALTNSEMRVVLFEAIGRARRLQVYRTKFHIGTSIRWNR